jgi:hypothetical protein
MVYGLENGETLVRFPTETDSLQTGSEANPIFYPNVTRLYAPGGKAAGA